MESKTAIQVKTPPSRHYFYRKATQQQPISPQVVDGLESAHAFENRIDHFISKNALQSSINKLRQEATVDLNRRKADRKARKEKENNNNTIEPIPSTPHDVLFEKLSSLSHSEQNAWLSNIHDDAMLMNPHQWLKLASLFNVNSKASRQQSLLHVENLECVLDDRGIKENDVRPLESYMELRDIQNRNYARDAVAEGVKFIKQNRVKEAMEFYKRALDMDPKYAEGWFHVAEGLVQQRKLSDAELHLDRVLKLDPTHEGAKALLASIRHTKNPKKAEKGEEWDIVDENGQALNTLPPEEEEILDEKDKLKSILKKRRQEDEKKRSMRRHESSSRYKKSSRRSSISPRRRRSPSPRSRHRRDDKSDRRSHRDSDRKSRRSDRSTRDYDNDKRRDRRNRDDDNRKSRDRNDDRKSRDRDDDDRKSRDRGDDRKSRDRDDDRKSRERDDDRKSRDREDDRKNRDYQDDKRSRAHEDNRKNRAYEDDRKNRDREDDKRTRNREDDRRKDRNDHRRKRYHDEDLNETDKRRRYHDNDKKSRDDTDKSNEERLKKDVSNGNSINDSISPSREDNRSKRQSISTN